MAKFQFNDTGRFSITEVDSIKTLIILTEQDQIEDLHQYLIDNLVTISISKDSNKVFVLIIKLKNGDSIKLDTKHTIENYPPLMWLIRGEVTHFTTGFFDDKNRLLWVDNLQSLDRPSLN